MRCIALTVTLTLALATAGCTGTLSYPGSADFQVIPGYDSRRPAEVAVLPAVGNLGPEANTALREALRARLLELRYAPVRLKEVDSHMADYRPGGKNAVLEVRITKWDDGGLFGDGSVLFSGEIRLVGAGSTEVLFTGKLDKIAVRASDVARSMDERPHTLAQVCAEAAARLLEGLPVKGDG
jgi:hypothetical protein